MKHFTLKSPKGKCVRRVAVLSLCFAMFAGSLPAQDISASIRIYYPETKKTVTYNDALITYKYNDMVLELNGLKGILTDNGVALGPYYELSKALGISYSKSGSTITLKKGSNTLVLTLGSKTALLNGVKTTANAAPVSIRFADPGITRIMVPTRFVAESLGFDYKWDSSTSTVSIQDRLTLTYNDKVLSYIGSTGKVTFDGRNIDVSKLPTILINNTAMLRAHNVFNKAMGISYSFNQSTGAIVFKKGDLTLKMQENSTVAYLNGVMKDCGVAPAMVTNPDTDTTALLVPGRFVAESLGYRYVWDSSKKTSVISTTDMVGVYIPPEPVEEEPEELVTYSFVTDEEKYLEYENMIDNTITSIFREDGSASTSFIEQVYRDLTSELSEKYIIQLGSPVQRIDSIMESDRLIVSIKDTVCAEKVYSALNGSLVSEVHQVFDSDDFTTQLSFQLSSEEYPYYSLALSEDGMQLEVLLYPNYLLGLETGKNRNGSYLRFHGISPFNYSIAQEDGYSVVYFTNTCNTLGNIVFPDELFEEYFDYALMLEPEQNNIKFLYKLVNGTSLTIIEESNDLYLYFDYKGTPEEDNNDTTDSDIPSSGGIFVRLPLDVELSDFTVEDQYWDKKIVLKVSGDYERYYQNNPIVSPYSVVNDISVSSTEDSTTITLSTSRIQGYSLHKDTDGFIIRLGNPSEIYDKIVVLDAGHGGIDPGASAGGYNEKDINYTILNNYTMAYFDNSDVKVYLSRTTDTKIDLYERASFASSVEADLFVSLHMNANNSTSIQGTSVYYSTLNTSVTSGGLDSKTMAQTFADNISAALGTRNRGVYTQNFVVVKETRMPAVLIELAFLTNASDRKIITTTSTQKIAAKTIYETIVQFFKDYPTGR